MAIIPQRHYGLVTPRGADREKVSGRRRTYQIRRRPPMCRGDLHRTETIMSIPYFMSDGTPVRDYECGPSNATPRPQGWRDAISAASPLGQALAEVETKEAARRTTPTKRCTEHTCICISRGNRAEIICTCGEFTTGNRAVETAIAEATMHRTLAENEAACASSARAMEVVR